MSHETVTPGIVPDLAQDIAPDVAPGVAPDIALSAELFGQHVGQTFQAQGGDHRLVLDKVDLIAAQPWHQERGLIPFALIFSGPPGVVLAEGIHTIRSEAGAAYTLHLMPIHTPAPGRQDYQAVFN